MKQLIIIDAVIQDYSWPNYYIRVIGSAKWRIKMKGFPDDMLSILDRVQKKQFSKTPTRLT